LAGLIKPANLFVYLATLPQVEWRKFAQGSRIAMEAKALAEFFHVSTDLFLGV
jgi:hypothetical protein